VKAGNSELPTFIINLKFIEISEIARFQCSFEIYLFLLGFTPKFGLEKLKVGKSLRGTKQKERNHKSTLKSRYF
jgi:hypothetical protein